MLLQEEKEEKKDQPRSSQPGETKEGNTAENIEEAMVRLFRYGV